MKNRAKVLVIVLLAAMFGPRSSHAVVLNVPQNYQEKDQWCWAATSQSLLTYYGVNLTQTEIAQYGTGGQNIPNFLAVSDATKNGVTGILDFFAGIASTGVVGPVLPDRLAQDLDVNGAPIG